MTVRFSWWGALAFSHRWLGIAGCLLFILWFVSGIAMIYVRMPAVTPAERFEHTATVNPDKVHVGLADAAAAAGGASGAVQLTMLGQRPVYRFSGAPVITVFADTGDRLGPVTQEAARDYAAAFASASPAALRYVGLVTIPDQWTLQSRAHLPLHQFALNNLDGTELYVSSVTGEVVMETSHAERFWAYLGPVAHWLYLPVLRRNGPLWTDVIIWTSIAGCVLCITGLIAGIWRFSPFRRFVIRRVPSMSPYAGWMLWHHYAGLLFGVVTLTWTFSGLLSMGPFPLLSSEGISAAQRRALTGAVGPRDAITLEHVRGAVTVASAALQPRELNLAAFRGAWYWIASEAPDRRVIVSASEPTALRVAFDSQALEDVARDSAAGAPLRDLTWLSDYDDYYYDRTRGRALPVLRARFGDAEETWMYLDPSRGAIALVSRRPDRLNRWLYHGLHSFDVSWLHNQRPLWDIVLIVLSIGGIAGAATSLLPAYQRLARHSRSVVRRIGRRSTHLDSTGSTAPDASGVS